MVRPPAILTARMPFAPSALAPERMTAIKPGSPGGSGAFEKHIDGRPRPVDPFVDRKRNGAGTLHEHVVVGRSHIDAPRFDSFLVTGLDDRKRRRAGKMLGECPAVARMQVLDHEHRHRKVRRKGGQDDRERLRAAGRPSHHNGPVSPAARQTLVSSVLTPHPSFCRFAPCHPRCRSGAPTLENRRSSFVPRHKNPPCTRLSVKSPSARFWSSRLK